jgi:hypothetical protein
MVHMVKNESYKIQKYNYAYGCSKHIAWKLCTRADNHINVKSTNIELASTKHCTNITNLHQQKRNNEIKHVIKT